MYDSLPPHGLQHTRLPCPSLLPRVCSNSCPLGQCCYLTISFSATPLLLLPSIFPNIRGFSNELALHIGWPKYWSFTFSVSPSNEYSGLISFRIGWFDVLAVQGLSRVIFSTTARKHQFFSAQPSLWSNSHICTWLLGRHGSEYLTLETISIFLNINWTCICITLYFFWGLFHIWNLTWFLINPVN